MNVWTHAITPATNGGSIASRRIGGPILRRLSGMAVSTFFWVALVKAGLVIGAAMTMAARFVQS